ncbi:hypothetical protein [Candidatus Uabimicrobium amorphum]|uniref:Uncharacterized protein n=1 Tax=Uabimicrobium amorphum TaxID=2596890 RepID=A0A5S9ILF0_UABAM|nr:hypothetical protein [Candidatus Uabimicrobium amorphum]BBM84043.1 hypothetical protein UABAM_02398 [Candidatus Uabimicrobium amorphum]
MLRFGFVLFLTVLFCASCTPKSKWQYDIQIVNPGTRSEGRRGHLRYGYKEIYYVKSRLMVPIGIFEYRKGKMPWEDRGWFKINNQGTNKNQIYLMDLNIWVKPKEIDKYYRSWDAGFGMHRK